MLKEIRPAVVSFLLLTLLTEIAYPLLVTGVSQLVMPDKANGSLIIKDGKPVGSSLIGQSFSDPKYFWSRPSATGPMPYNASASSGSNLGPTNPALMDAVKGRVQALRDADPGNQQAVPVDLVTASGSGLEPHISLLEWRVYVTSILKHCTNWWRNTQKVASLVFWAKLG